MTDLQLQNARLNQRYEIQRLLGRGSYSEIYAAKDIIAAPGSTHEYVVIKALNVFMQNDLDHDLERTLVENFQNEARALDKVRHPNIISRLGHGTSRDSKGILFHYLVLEMMHGGDLGKLCRKGELTFSDSLSYLEQICAGIAHAHLKEVIHRDIKPQNMLVTENKSVVKVADFGVARFVESENPITRVGTNIFAPPEHSPLSMTDSRILSYTELTPAADIYSLAKSAYVMFTGESPRVFTNHPISDLPHASKRKPWAKDVLAILNRATQNDPRNRFQTIEAFWGEFSQLNFDSGEVLTQIAKRKSTTPKPQLNSGYTPTAPVEPTFKATAKLQFKPHMTMATQNLPVAVQAIERNPLIKQKKRPEPTKPIKDSKETALPAKESGHEVDNSSEPRRPHRLRNFVLFVALISVFAGSLYATYNFLSSRGATITNIVENAEMGTATTNVNLRASPSPRGSKVGMVTLNSRVKVVKRSNNWYEIVIIEYGEPKTNRNFRDSGWAYGKYIKLDE